MISTLTITGLNQGKLYGQKPTIDVLEANGAVIDEAVIATPLGKLHGLFARHGFDWTAFFTSFAGKTRS